MARKPTYEELEKRVEQLQKAKNDLEFLNRELSALQNLTSLAHADNKKICDHILYSLSKMTRSQYGFYGFVANDASEMNIYAWSPEAMTDCSVKVAPKHFPIKKAGIWAEAIRHKKPFIENNYNSAEASKKGLPTGHVPIKNLLVVPFIRGDQVLSVSAVANKSTGYGQEDITQIESFLFNTQALMDLNLTEIKLTESERKFRHFVSRIPGTAYQFAVSENGHIRFDYMEPSCMDLFGFSADEILQDPQLAFNLIPEPDAQMVNRAIQESARTMKPYDIEHRVIKKNGELVWIHASSLPREGDDGDVIWDGIGINITEHKKAQSLLEEKDKALRLSLDAARAGTWTWDVKTDEVVWDDQMQKIFGLEPGAFDGTFQAWKQRVHPDDATLAEQKTLNALNTGISYEHQYRVKGLSGDWRWVNAQAATLLDENRTPIRMSGFAVDITDRKFAEEKLRESEAKYRMLFENAEDAIFVADPDTGYLIEVNKKAEELTGYNRSELIGKHQTFIHPPEYADFYEQEFQKSIKSEGAKFREMLVQTRDGLKVPVEISAGGTIQTSEGKLHIGIFRNISERKQAEQALKDSEERFAIAMEFANDGLFDWNLETNDIYYSPVWKRMLGYAEDELPNDFSVWEKLTDPQDVKRSWKMQNELIEKKRDRFEIDFKMRHKDGHWVDILSRANAIFDESGKAVRIVGTHVDISDRKKAEVAIQKSEQKYRHLIQTASDAIYLITEDGRFSDVNPAACSMLNRSRKEILNFDISAIDPNFGVEAFINFWKETPLNEPRVFETTHLHKDGSLVPVEVSGQKFQVGEEVFFFGIARNITDRKKAEAHLRKSQLIIESTSDAIISTDVNGVITFWNSGAERLYGYKCEEVLNKPISLIYKEEDLPILQNLITDLIQGKDLSNENVTCIDKEGNDVEILLSLMTIKDENQDVIELVGFTKDISELKRYEKEIIKQKEKAERYLNLAGVIFIALNRNGEVTLINKKGCETLGYEYSEIIGKNWFENFIPAYLRDDLIPISKKLLNGDIEPVEYYENPIITRSGDERLIAWHNTILKDGEGNITGHLSSGEDITEKTHLEAQLLKAQKMESIGQLAGGIAHDFNNLLFPIIGMSELLLEDLSEGSPEHENAQEILKAGKRGSDLVKQILAFSRQSEHQKRPIRIQQVLKEVLRLCRATIPSDIEIMQDIQTDCGMVVADPTQLHQVGMNLITNAYHAVEKFSGKITISLKQEYLRAEDLTETSLQPGGYAVINVTDTGHGIDPTLLNKIFEPYFTTKETGKGTGLGLAVVYGIIKDHGGDVQVDSRLGVGTTFSVYLPLKSQSFQTNTVQKEETFQAGSEKILLVDDEEPIAKLEKQMLERLGYKVTAFTSSVDALSKFKEDPSAFDLVITDMTMPNLTGEKLARELLSIRSALPVIICTGFSERMNQVRAESMGIKDFLMKPVVKSDLAKTVRKVIDEAKG
jgi:PAS domain S-box-containing protein